MLCLEKLDKKKHDRKSFDCGHPELNNYIKKVAKQDVENGAAQVYVLVEEDQKNNKIYGYFTLNAFAILSNDLPFMAEKKPRYPNSPAVLIGRLAKDLNQDILCGSEILYAALKTVKKISGELGAAFVVVHAIDKNAENFYIKNGFFPLISESTTLIFPIHAIK